MTTNSEQSFTPASKWRRFVASFIDLLITTGLFFLSIGAFDIIWQFMWELMSDYNWYQTSVYIFLDIDAQLNLSLLFLWILPTLYLWIPTGLTGQTLGKKMLRLRVVHLDGATLGIWSAFAREICGRVGLWILLWWVIFDRNQRGVHDRMAYTRVVMADSSNNDN